MSRHVFMPFVDEDDGDDDHSEGDGGQVDDNEC